MAGNFRAVQSTVFCIEKFMRRAVAATACVLVLALAAVAGISGSFRGKIVQYSGPGTDHRWLYVEGRNEQVRRVEISHAQVEYDEDVPEAARQHDPQDGLVAGAEVRVTAEQGGDGEWHASRVEILRPAAGSP